MYRLAVFIAAVCAMASTAQAADPIELVKTPIQKAYIPVGFDDNDRTEMYVTGFLPDGCHRIGPYQVNVDERKQTVAIEQSAYRHPGLCISMLIPYAHVANLGVVGSGDYQVVDSASSKALGQLSVARSTKPIIDDFIYLPLSNAYVTEDQVTKEANIILEGEVTDRCTKYKETQVHYSQDVIVVQPIAERIGSRSCGFEPTRFRISVPLKSGLKGSYLIHVRAMSGEAVNSLFTFGS